MLLAVDKDGFYLGFDVLSVNTIDNTSKVIEATPENFPIDGNIIKPKYDGTSWIEGATKQEIEDAHSNQGIIISGKPREEVLAETVNFLGLQIAELKMNSGDN